MNKMIKFLRSNRITLLCIGLLTLMVVAAWQSMKTPLDPSIEAEYFVLEGEPAYGDIVGFHADDIDWKPYDFPIPPPMPAGATTVYLSFEIPASARFVGDHLLFTTTNQDAYVYVDNDLVYTHGDWASLMDTRGRAFHYVYLDNTSAGKRLTIMLHSGYRNWLGSIDYLKFGNERLLINKLSATDAIYIASLAVAFSLVALLIVGLIWRDTHLRRRTNLYLILFLVSFILWTSGTSSFFPRVFGMAHLWWEVHLIMLYVLPLSLIPIIREIVSPRFIRHVQTMWNLFRLVFALATLAELVGMGGYMNFLFIYYPLLLVGFLILIFTVVRSNWDRHPVCRYATLSLTSFIIFGGLDAYHWEYHRTAVMLATTVFSVYTTLPFIFFLMREQMLNDAKIARENTALSQELEQTQAEAVHDYLTGCYNRQYLQTAFEDFSRLADERGFRFSFAIFDVDRFKSVNDTKGHLEGDNVLKKIAETVRGEIDRRHVFIRYGGDEFILLALHYDLAEMAAFCEDRRGKIAGALGGVTTSFGVSTWHGPKDRLRALIDRADRALYLSKEKGRNAVSAEDEGDVV
nr:GGDEF domain-containing protein [Selenomonas sp. F0473]